MTHYFNSQATICWMAARSFSQMHPDLFERYGVNDTYVGMIADHMGDCIDYSSHKYISNRESIESWVGSRPGAGVVGFWSFKDGSKLIKMCSRSIQIDGKWTIGPDLYVAVNPDSDDPKAPIVKMWELETAWPATKSKRIDWPSGLLITDEHPITHQE